MVRSPIHGVMSDLAMLSDADKEIRVVLVVLGPEPDFNVQIHDRKIELRPLGLACPPRLSLEFTWAEG